MLINEGNYGEKCYKIYLNTGTAWLADFEVYAYCESEAVEVLAEHIVAEGLDGLWFSYYDLADECEPGESVDEYVEKNNLIVCDKGVHLPLARMEEVSV